MSRSGYTDYWEDQWGMIMYRGAVKSAIRGKRGQAFLKEMLSAMDALPEPRLIAHELQEVGGGVCAIGSVGKSRGLDMSGLDPEDSDRIANVFGIAPALAKEIVYMNDEGNFRIENDEQRYERMRKWIESHISKLPPARGGE